MFSALFCKPYNKLGEPYCLYFELAVSVNSVAHVATIHETIHQLKTRYYSELSTDLLVIYINPLSRAR